jgi:hypothetical protein
MLSELGKELNLKFDSAVVKSLWSYHGLADYFTTMRDFKRFFNSLSFRLPLISDDVNVHDFLAIEAIRLFDNESYDKFYSIYSVNLRKREVPESVFREDQLKQFKTPAADIIKAIFPKSTLEAFRTDTNLKRVYDPAYFERYFSLLRNENDISEKDFREFMTRVEARNNILEDAIKYERIGNLLKRLNDDAIAKHFPKYDYGVVESLINFFGSRCSEFEKHSNQVSDAIINLVSSSK